MSKITTADCRKWLAADPQVQKIVADSSGHSDYLAGREPLSSVEMTWVTNGKNPKKWKRRGKYNVGSKTDTDGGIDCGGCDFGDNEFVKQETGVDPTGGVIREFWLEDTDHVTIALLEKDGQLYYLDDLSD